MSEESLKKTLQKILQLTLVNIFIYFQEVGGKGNFTCYFQVLVYSIKHYHLKPFPFHQKETLYLNFLL